MGPPEGVGCKSQSKLVFGGVAFGCVPTVLPLATSHLVSVEMTRDCASTNIVLMYIGFRVPTAFNQLHIGKTILIYPFFYVRQASRTCERNKYFVEPEGVPVEGQQGKWRRKRYFFSLLYECCCTRRSFDTSLTNRVQLAFACVLLPLYCWLCA